MNFHGGFIPSAAKPQLDLAFSVNASGNTWLSRRRVRFPYTIGAPFRLDGPSKRETLILQSASGGLYEGERLHAAIRLEHGADVSIVTPGATVVNSARGRDHAAQIFSLDLDPGATLLFIPRMNILLPGARLALSTHAQLGEGSRLLYCDGFCLHRPAGLEGSMDWLRTSLSVSGRGGGPILHERSLIDGTAFANGMASSFHAFGTVVFAAPRSGCLDRTAADALAAELTDLPSCYCGATPLRANSGLLFRLAAVDGGALDAACQKVVSHLRDLYFMRSI